jgi:hypothetical protein
MEEIVQNKKCKQQPTCKVAIDGKCLESLALSECPHFYLEEEPLDTGDKPLKETEPKVQPGYELFSGTEFNLNNVSFITNMFKTNMVFIIGESDSGKTTVLTTLYDLLQEGPYRNYRFAGSLSQIGFESRCHFSRIASNGNISQTEKTKLGEFGFLHLALQKNDEPTGKTSHLLISDISGERFQSARDSSSEMKKLELLRQIPSIYFFIDGKRLANKRERTSAIFNAEQFINRAIDTKIFTDSTNLFVVISKRDLLFRAAYNLDSLKASLTKKFSPKLASLNFIEIAVRPENPGVPFKLGGGLELLLNEWTKETGRKEEAADEVQPTNGSKRYFNNYKIPEEIYCES